MGKYSITGTLRVVIFLPRIKHEFRRLVWLAPSRGQKNLWFLGLPLRSSSSKPHTKGRQLLASTPKQGDTSPNPLGHGCLQYPHLPFHQSLCHSWRSSMKAGRGLHHSKMKTANPSLTSGKDHFGLLTSYRGRNSKLPITYD